MPMGFQPLRFQCVNNNEAQLKETEAAWSETVKQCDLLEAEVSRLRMDKGKALSLDMYSLETWLCKAKRAGGTTVDGFSW